MSKKGKTKLVEKKDKTDRKGTEPAYVYITRQNTLMEKLCDPTACLDLLKVLTTPGTATCDSDSETSGVPFDKVLKSTHQNFVSESQKSKYEKIRKRLDHADRCVETSIRWRYTQDLLQVLDVLSMSITNALEKFNEEQERKKSAKGGELKPSQAPPLSPDTLGVGQQKTVLTAIQFVIVLGVSPYLQEGVGLQASKRTSFGDFVSLENDEELDQIDKSLRMISCLRILLKCCKIESLGTLLLSRHLGDILAALLQLVHGQKQLISNSNQSHNRNVHHINVQNVTKDSTKGTFKEIPPDKWSPAMAENIAITVKGSQAAVGQNGKTELLQQTDEKLYDKSSNLKSKVLQQDNFREKEGKTCSLKKDIEFCEESLNYLLESLSQPLLVRELMVLQGGPGKVTQQKGDGVNKSVKPVLIRAPAWLRRTCGQLLTGILMKPQGVLHVLHGMLGNTVADAGGNLIADWRRFDAVAKVIANCPKMSSSTEEYYKQLAPQILSLLHQPNKHVAKHFLRVACSAISNMAASHPDLTEKYIISPLLKPLLSCLEDQDFQYTDIQQVEIEEQSLILCIEDLHKVFVSGSEPSSTLCNFIVPVLHPLFHIYCFSKQGVSHLRSSLHEILVTCLKQYPMSQSLMYLKSLVLDLQTGSDIKNLHPCLTCGHGESGGIVIITKSKDSQDLDPNKSMEGVLDLMKDLQRHGLTGEFFLFMMKELSSIISGEMTDASPIQSTNAYETETMERKIHILNLLASMCESIGPSCLTNTQQTLDFVEVTLERAVQILKACEDETTTCFENETLTMAMGLITSVLSGGLKCSEEDRNHMKRLLPLLESLADKHLDSEVQEMASDLRVAIATHGVIWSERLTKSSNRKEENYDVKSDPKNKTIPTKPLIEEIVDNQETSTSSKTIHVESSTVSPLQEALTELCDPLIPVRGHGLITLCRLLETRDREAMEKQEVLCKIFEENLNHQDTYLYLTSVRGLALLADKFPDVVIPKLATEFAGFVKTERKSELRMKIGEILVQTTRRLGDLAPKYRDVMLPALLNGTIDDDPLVRASSLSNLGEICKVLKFTLGSVIHEIFNCCQSLLKTDDDTEVRKGAAILTTLLLQGLGKDALKVLDSVLLELYKLLKLTLKTEKDEKVKDHILLSLNELDEIMRDFLFPKQTLQKKITVLNQT